MLEISITQYLIFCLEIIIILATVIGFVNGVFILKYISSWCNYFSLYYISVELMTWPFIMLIILIPLSYSVIKNSKKSLLIFSYIIIFISALFLYSLFHHNSVYTNLKAASFYCFYTDYFQSVNNTNSHYNLDTINKIQKANHCCGCLDPNEYYQINGDDKLPITCCIDNVENCSLLYTETYYTTGCCTKLHLKYTFNISIINFQIIFLFLFMLFHWLC
ncbi:hypothetical protein HZS_2602 [Henneguya salminicola]|nr:hypothetical protein HZS_2602 [Henneguya salminicola]